MDELIRFLEGIKSKLTFKNVMFEVVGSNGRMLRFIVELNTEEQLFKKGEDARGDLLEQIGGSYSPFTILIKSQLRLPTDRVTLFQTGEFYDTFVARVIKSGDIEITADLIKDGDDLSDRWGDHIVGLNEEHLELLRARIREQMDIWLRTQVFRL